MLPGALSRLNGTKESLAMDRVCIEMCLALGPGVWNVGCVAAAGGGGSGSGGKAVDSGGVVVL